MVHLVVGHGEVGLALCKVLDKPLWVDKGGGTWNGEDVDVVHICIPYNKDFKYTVGFWKANVKLVIVHSTTPVGTCDGLGVVHSPIRGVHPHLEDGIRTFVKYFGGKDSNRAAKIFSDLGIKTKVYKEARITEGLKLWDTSMYGIMILIEKEIYRWCQENDIPFKIIYEEANKTYNQGYTELGRSEVVRPFLKHIEGKIGGHCILPNANLLKGTWITKQIIKTNDKL